MYLLTFIQDHELRLGVKLPGGIFDVKAVSATAGNAGDIPLTVDALVKSDAAARARLEQFVMEHPSAPLLDEAKITYGPCLPNPGKIICLGMNYRKHAAKLESGQAPSPILFSKYLNTVAASGEMIPLPPVAEQYDYEAELAVVIGRRAQNVAEADALKYVFGYCNSNDLSARDLQKRTSQWMLGKTLDKFFPIGPYLVTVDEIPDPQALSLRAWMNGNLGQETTTGEMIFSVPYLISYISQHFTLEAGDIIATGTPERAANGTAERRWLKAGDTVTVEVQGLGKLTNTMC